MKRSRTWKTAILASGQVATALVSLLVAMVLSRVFDKPDYATYQQTILVYNIIAPLLALGLPAALYYFLPGEEERARGILAENLLLLTLAGVVFSIFLLLGGNVLLAQRFSNPELEKTLLLFALYPIAALPATATTACLMARDKVSWVALFTIVTRLIRLVVVLSAVWLISPTPRMAISATVVAAVITFGISITLMLRSMRGTGGSLGLTGMKAQLAYSVPMGLGAMIATLHRGLDKLVVSLFTIPDNFAVYVNGALEIPFIGVVTGSATAVLLPEMRQLMKANNYPEALRIWKRAGVKAGVIIIPLAGILVAAAPDLMALLYTEKYRESYVYFRIYALLLPIRIVIFGAVFQAAGRTDIILKRAVIALGANLLLSLLFASLFGYELVALATVLVVYLAAVPYSLWMVGKVMGTKVRDVFPWTQVVKLILVSTIGALLAILVGNWIPWDITIVHAAGMGIVYAAVMALVLPRIGLFRLNLRGGVSWKRRIEWTI